MMRRVRCIKNPIYARYVNSPLFWVLSFKPMDEVEGLMSEMESGRNPQEIKRLLAEELIERFHDADAAVNAHKSAGNVLADGELPVDLPEVTLDLEGQDALFITQILNQAKLAKIAQPLKIW